MGLRKRGKYRYGDSQSDIREALQTGFEGN
jgi:hypothetical protein